MARPATHRIRFAAASVAVLSPVASHIAIALGQGYGIAVAFAAAQAVATGLILSTLLPARRWLGLLVAAALLAALALGAPHGAPAALLAEAGTAHAILYAGLLALFAASLRPGRVAIVTWLATRLNPHFHAGQVPYTRAVTWAWVALFAAQLLASLVLLAIDRPLWRAFVTTLHLVPLPILAMAEAAVRRWRWRHEHSTGLIETIRGTRRLLAQRASSSSQRS